MVTPAARREAARYLRQAYEMSERRACRVIGSDRTSVRYQAVRPDDGELRERLKALAQERRRFGYRRLHVLLRREGHAVNKKRVQRLYREERLTVRRRGGRKRAIGTRRPMVTPLAADQRWSLDFVSDQLTDGRRFRILAVVDDCTRECLALIADTSISGRRVARELDGIVRRRGQRPDTIVSDNVLSGDARALFRQQVSFAGVPPVDEHQFRQVASTAQGVALSHSKHRVHRVVALTVLKTRCAIQVEDPNIIYRVAATATPSRHYRGRVLPLGTGASGKGR